MRRVILHLMLANPCFRPGILSFGKANPRYEESCAEWGGNSDISDLLAKSLNISDGSKDARKVGPGWAEPRVHLLPSR